MHTHRELRLKDCNFGTVTKTRNGAFVGGGYQGGARMEYYEKIQYQACRFCGASIEKLKL